ncbi:collagen alpha-1(I) chain-like [Macrobrachium nipponense]|uniref:collagen alpha-1(I) chain-like n=1 Tax=Macrobrachium nipponense TaxID=159736 RepID=UPI0030C84072
MGPCAGGRCPSLATGTAGGPVVGPGAGGRCPSLAMGRADWAGDVRHLSRDGRARPAVGPGGGGGSMSGHLPRDGRAGPAMGPARGGRAMSVTCHGTGGPGLPWVPVWAGDVRHLPRDGRAGPAVGPGEGGRCPSLATGRAGRACRGSRGGRAMSVTCHGTGGPGLPWVPVWAGDVRHLPRDGRAGPAVGPGEGGRCPSLATGWAGRACRGSRCGAGPDVALCHGRSGSGAARGVTVWAGDVRHLPRAGRAGPAVGPGAGGRCPSLATGRAGRACRGSRCGRAMSVTCLGTGGPGLPWVPVRAGDVRHLPRDGRAGPAVGPGEGGRCPSLATGPAGRACHGSR